MCCSLCLGFTECIAKGTCCLGNHSSKMMRKDIKVAYGVNMLFFATLIFLLLYFGSGIINFLAGFIGCPNDGDLDACLGLSAAFRYLL